jgi:hypothetical protein
MLGPTCGLVFAVGVLSVLAEEERKAVAASEALRWQNS